MGHLLFNNKAEDLHLSLAVRADKRIYLPHLSYALSPPKRRDPAGTVLSHIDHRQLAWDMLGDISDKLIGRADGEVLFIFSVGHLRAVDHHARRLVVTELVQRKRIADDVLGQGSYRH